LLLESVNTVAGIVGSMCSIFGPRGQFERLALESEITRTPRKVGRLGRRDAFER
jgi:hypothetical protein